MAKEKSNTMAYTEDTTMMWPDTKLSREEWDKLLEMERALQETKDRTKIYAYMESLTKKYVCGEDGDWNSTGKSCLFCGRTIEHDCKKLHMALCTTCQTKLTNRLRIRRPPVKNRHHPRGSRIQTLPPSDLLCCGAEKDEPYWPLTKIKSF